MKQKGFLISAMIAVFLIIVSCDGNKEKAQGNRVLIVYDKDYDTYIYAAKNNDTLSRVSFSIHKGEDGFYGISCFDTEIHLWDLCKKKCKYKIKISSCPDSKETARELAEVLRVAEKNYPIDSVRHIRFYTSELLDIANELAMKLPQDWYWNNRNKNVETVISQTPLKANIDGAMGNYGLEVSHIGLVGTELKPLMSDTRKYNRGVFYSEKEGKEPRELLFVPLTITVDRKRETPK